MPMLHHGGVDDGRDLGMLVVVAKRAVGQGRRSVAQAGGSGERLIRGRQHVAVAAAEPGELTVLHRGKTLLLQG